MWRRALDVADRPRRLARARARRAQAAASVVALAAGLAPVVVTAWLLDLRRARDRALGDRRLPRAVDARPARSGCSCACSRCRARVLAIATLEGLRTLLRAGRGRCSRRGDAGARSARCWPRASATARCRSPTGCPTASIFVDELGPARAAARARLRPRLDRGRARRPPRRGDHPRRRARHRPRARQRRRRGAALAIDNERLKADLRARVEELRVSRAAHRRGRRRRAPAASSATSTTAPSSSSSRSRSTCGCCARGSTTTRRAASVDALVGAARRRARRAARARARHPPGDPHRARPRPAVAALAERAPLPVEVDVVDPTSGSPPAIEAAAYFVVAEALTNVAKYAQRRERASSPRATARSVVVVVEDDGVGGADIDAGTGLRGLVDRLSALDGTLELDSPPGGGTRLIARIPCAPPTRRRPTRRSPRRGGRAMRRGILLSRCCWCSRSPPAAARSPRSASPTWSSARASSPPRPPTGARRAASGASGSPSSRTGRPRARSGRSSRNGVDAAARQMDVSVSYRSPDTFSVAAHARAHRPRRSTAGPTASSSRSPTRPLGPAIRRAVRAGIPVVSINSGATLWRGLGVLAHVGQPEEPRRATAPASGWRPRACARAVRQPGGRQQRRSTSAAAGSPAAMRAARRDARACSASTSQDRDGAAPKLAAAIARAAARRRR